MDGSSRNSTPGRSLSPRLQRSRSVAPADLDTQPFSPNFGRISRNRSKSASKTRATSDKDEENQTPRSQDQSRKPVSVSRRPQENLAGIFYPHRVSDVAKAAEAGRAKKERSAGASSPSAWALSPGRSPSPTPTREQSTYGGASKKAGGSVSSMLRLFRQRKMPSAREETFHQLRTLQTRLLQWRFVNARAEAAMAARKSKAQRKLLSVWLETFRKRNLVMEKRIQVQKLRAEIKLHGILRSQIPLLKEWDRIDKRNLEAVTKSATILRAVCLNIPLVGGAKANIFDIYRAFCTALDVMNGIEESVSKFLFQVERMSSLLTELSMVVKQERESLESLIETVTATASLEVEETSLRVHLIQAMKDRATLHNLAFGRLSNTLEHTSFASTGIFS